MSDHLEMTWDKGSKPVPVLHLKGRLDAAGAKQLHEASMTSLKEDNQEALLVDLAGVDFVASTGLATFLLLTEEYAEVKGTIVFVGATPAVMQVISLLNIDQFLKLEDSMETACDLVGA